MSTICSPVCLPAASAAPTTRTSRDRRAGQILTERWRASAPDAEA